MNVNMPQIRDAIDRLNILADDTAKQAENDYRSMHNMLSVGEQDMPLYSDFRRRAEIRKQTAADIRMLVSTLEYLL